jgi:hypothetical protein
MPSASMEEALDDSLQHTAGSLTFRLNEVCAMGGVWPELSSPTAPMMSPAPPVAMNAKLHLTSPVGSSWGSSSVQHFMRQTPLQSVASPRIEAFPTLSRSVHTKKVVRGLLLMKVNRAGTRSNAFNLIDYRMHFPFLYTLFT